MLLSCRHDFHLSKLKWEMRDTFVCSTTFQWERCLLSLHVDLVFRLFLKLTWNWNGLFYVPGKGQLIPTFSPLCNCGSIWLTAFSCLFRLAKLCSHWGNFCLNAALLSFMDMKLCFWWLFCPICLVMVIFVEFCQFLFVFGCSQVIFVFWRTEWIIIWLMITGPCQINTSKN